MRGKLEGLRRRGKINQSDINKYKDLSNDDLFDMMYSKNAVERTVAVNILSKKYINNIFFANIILDKLCKEKCLYTRIEICKSLEMGDTNIARLMINYLGKIGKNQYLSLPEKVSKKKSYPLPRDLIARTLGKMDTSIFNILLEEAVKENTSIEIIDAIGYMAYYNEELATENNLYKIFNIMTRDIFNKLIIYKITTCLSAFNCNKSIEMLNKIKKNYSNTIIYDEANRSLELISLNSLKLNESC